MGEDSSVQPLPRRVPGATKGRWPAAPPVHPALPESVLQRVRAAMDAKPGQAASPEQASPEQASPEQVASSGQASQEQAAGSRREASLPGRMLGTKVRPGSPARVSRVASPTTLLGRMPDPEADTMPIAVIPGPASSGVVSPADETAAKPDRPAKPPADHRPAAVVRPSGELRPNQQAMERKAVARRTYRLVGASVLIIAFFAAGSLALTLFRHTGHRASAEVLGSGVATRNHAAAWVAGQVSRADIVACDPVMCKALEVHGIPNGDLLDLGPTADPRGSDVIVATAAVRSEFGSVLSSVYAPAVIASFGSGNLRITIRAIAPGGAAKYRSALSADLMARKASGTQLLHSTRIVVTAKARRQLAAGQVDSRLLITMAGMAALQPLHIVAFGDSSPGAGADIPLRSVDLAETNGAARAGSTEMRSMLAFLHAQRPPYLAARAEIVRLARGRMVLRVEFAAPSRLGLLSPDTP